MLIEADLPCDIEALRALALVQSRMLATERAAKADLATAKREADVEIERLQSIINPDQLQLGFEDIEAALGAARAAREAGTEQPKSERPRKTNRGALPAHLERIEQVVDVADQACPCRGGALHHIGEDVA